MNKWTFDTNITFLISVTGGQFYAKALNAGTMVVKPLTQCARFHFVKMGNICLDSPNKTVPCFGDAGAPLVDTQANVLVGLATMQQACFVKDTQVHIDVREYLEWIRNEMAINVPTNLSSSQ